MREYFFNKYSISVFSIFILTAILGRELYPEEVKRDKVDPGKNRAISSVFVKNIKAVKIPHKENMIKVSWDLNRNLRGKLVIGRSHLLIDSQDKALDALTVGVVSAGKTNYIIDRGLKPGVYYYVVLASEKIINIDFTLLKDINYTSKAVIILPSKSGNVRSIKAVKESGEKVILSWEFDESPDTEYAIYRGREILDSGEKLKKAEKLATVRDKRIYTDDVSDNPGIYYYAVTVIDTKGVENMNLIPEQNYTLNGIEVEYKVKSGIISHYTIKLVEAKMSNGKVVITWDYEGERGNRYYKLYRSKRLPGNIDDIEDKQLVAVVDITKRRYEFFPSGEGSGYYGFAPLSVEERSNFKIRSGENITRQAIVVQEGLREGLSIKQGSKNLDRIIHETYFRGKYRQASKEMELVIRTSQNRRDVAKAKLFLGRSLIRMKRYKKAYLILIQDDVKKYFPEEADFWSYYIIMLRNKTHEN